MLYHPKNIGKRIRQLREDAGLSQEELGRLAGVTGGTISVIETGKFLKLATVEKVARVLGMEVAIAIGSRVDLALAQGNLVMFAERNRMLQSIRNIANAALQAVDWDNDLELQGEEDDGILNIQEARKKR